MQRHKELELVRVITMPPISQMEQGKIYLSEEYQTAIHLCACGCGELTVTPLIDSGWSYKVEDEKLTLSPSIGNYQFACKSHYFLNYGRVDWL